MTKKSQQHAKQMEKNRKKGSSNRGFLCYCSTKSLPRIHKIVTVSPTGANELLALLQGIITVSAEGEMKVKNNSIPVMKWKLSPEANSG